MFQLGRELERQGNEVQYFGMEHPDRVVGNRIGAYTRTTDYHTHNPLLKLQYLFRTVYSRDARKQLRKVLDDFKPSVIHLNNFNYQLTPSIIIEARRWQRKHGTELKIVYTAHDYQLICPAHTLYIQKKGLVCTKCVGGHYSHCVKESCVHDSFARSLLAAFEGFFWRKMQVYREIDCIIAPSQSTKELLGRDMMIKRNIIVLHNFIDATHTDVMLSYGNVSENNYILYAGRLSVEKGVESLIEAAEELPDVTFVIAGNGSLQKRCKEIANIIYVGFRGKSDLLALMDRAKAVVFPSVWYEVYGLTAAESIKRGIPVVASKIGALPEFVKNEENGLLFRAGDTQELKKAICRLYEDFQLYERLKDGCRRSTFLSVSDYYHSIMGIYGKKKSHPQIDEK
ncbi:MAG: glycosyltransferase [Lachnospiraceae bacterium]|nr:glycosyltransferase [Lachnospiraceae bacterium]